MSSINSLVSGDAGFTRPVVTGADFVECGQKFGLDVALRLLSYGESSLDYLKRCASTQAAATRSANSSSSLGSSTKSSHLAGPTGTRLASIRRVSSWRDGGVNRETAYRFPDGLCYGKLFDPSFASDQTMRCGSWPTFGSLVRLGANKFHSLEELERFRVVKRGDDVFHVAAGGSDGVSFLDAVASYGSNIKAQPGTLVHSVLISDRLRSRVPFVVKGGSRVGGDVVPSFDGFSAIQSNIFQSINSSSSPFSGLFGQSDGVSVSSVCPSPYGASAVVLSLVPFSVSDAALLVEAGFSFRSTVKLRANGTRMYVLYLSQANNTVSSFVTDRVMKFERQFGAKVVTLSAFNSITSRDLVLV